MICALKNRSLMSLDELSASDVDFLLDMARELKRAKRAGAERPQLRGRNIALLGAKAAARTRSAFEAAAEEQGAIVTVVGHGDPLLGDKDALMETARVLGRLYDAIECRGIEPGIVSVLAQFAGVPVHSGLTRPFHPTQRLADYLTMQEHRPDKALSQMRLAYLGDASGNMGDSLLQGAVLVGLDLRIAAPRALWPSQASINAAQAKTAASGARLRLLESPEEAVHEVDFICTDTWVCPGQPDPIMAPRIAQLKPYRVTADLLASSGNPAVKFMHCLPSLHDLQARKGGEVYRKYGTDGLEVTDEVFESAASVVVDQAENRLHTVKALLVATLA